MFQIVALAAMSGAAQTGFLSDLAHMLDGSNNWPEGNGQQVVIALSWAFKILFIVPLSLALTGLRKVGVEPKIWMRLTPFGLLLPSVIFVTPWIGLNIASTTIASIATPDRSRPIDRATVILAIVFFAKAAIDRYFLLRFEDPNAPVYKVVFSYGLEIAASLILLVAFWLYWRRYMRAFARAIEVHRAATVEAAF